MIRIRSATAEDAAALARIYVETWRDTYAGILPDAMLQGMSDVRHAAAWRHELAADGDAGSTLVAEDQRHGLVGLATVGRARHSSRAFVDGGEIYRLYVEPASQGQGFGKALLATSFDWLGRRGHAAAIVWVVARNPSRFFYEAQGGKRLGTRTEKLGATPVDEVAYGWISLKGP